MKVSIFSFLLFFCGFSQAQNYFVIDASAKTAAIFDQEDPKSYMSLLMQNCNYLGFFEKEGINEKDLQTLTNEQRVTLTPYIGRAGDIPLIDMDPRSETFGEELIVYDSLSGAYSYVYPAPDTMYTDLVGVSRILLKYWEGSGPLIDRVSEVVFCKKYADSYVAVLKVAGNSILSLDGFQYMEKLSSSLKESLISESPNGYWQQCKDSALVQGEKYYLDLHYFQMTSTFPIWTGYDRLPEEVSENSDADWRNYAQFDDLDPLPFDFMYGDSLYNNHEFLSVLLNDFDSVSYVQIDHGEPLIEEDPDLPDFGEFKIVLNESGEYEFLYPAPDVYFRWVEYRPSNCYAISSFVAEGSGMKMQLEKLVFTKNAGAEDHVVSVHNTNKYWQELAGDEVTRQKQWKKRYAEIQKGFTKGKKMNMINVKHLEELNMSPHFWRSFN